MATNNTTKFLVKMLGMTPSVDNQISNINGNVSPILTSNYFRSSGKTHGGVDFQYDESVWLSQQTDNTLRFSDGPVNSSHPSVKSPITGVVIDTNGTWGWVTIDSTADQTIHRILHLDSISVSISESQKNVSESTIIGNLGGRGKYQKNSSGQLVNNKNEVITTSATDGPDALRL